MEVGEQAKVSVLVERAAGGAETEVGILSLRFSKRDKAGR